MKIKCKRDEFARVFTVLSSISAKGNVKIAVDSAITLTAADGAIGGRGIADGVIERPGEVVLNAALLKKILAEMNCDEFSLELDGQALLTGGRCKYRLDTYDAKKFPVVEPFAEADYTIPAKPFQDLIRRTVFATDLDNTHYDLGCVMLIIEPGRALGVATDGRRLAYQAIKCDTEATGDALLLPRTLNLIDRVIATTNAENVLFTKKNSQQAAFKIGDFEFTSVVKDGKFPDWRSILPRKSDCKRVDFIAGELARAVRQAGIVASENKPGVTLSFQSGSVNVSAAGEAIGESSVDLPIDYDGEEKRLRLDARFLNDFFKNVGATENVAFYFGEDYRTMLETADGYQYIVMQMV